MSSQACHSLLSARRPVDDSYVSKEIDLFDQQVGSVVSIRIGDGPARLMRITGKGEPREVEPGIVETTVQLVEVDDHDCPGTAQEGPAAEAAGIGRPGADQAGSGRGPGCPDGSPGGEASGVGDGSGVQVSLPAVRQPDSMFTVEGTGYPDIYASIRPESRYIAPRMLFTQRQVEAQARFAGMSPEEYLAKHPDILVQPELPADMYDVTYEGAGGGGVAGGLTPPPPMPGITDEQLRDFAQKLGIELVPWQLELMKAFVAQQSHSHTNPPQVQHGRGRP